MKLMALGKKSSNSRPRTTWPRYVVCLDNEGNLASLEVGKVYRQVKPQPLDMKGWIRVIDESGEDYLFPARRFVAIELPPRARKTVATAPAIS